MKGRIYKIIESKQIGFLIDEKGENRFFHFSSVTQGQPTVDCLVDFTESSNKNGGIAEKISLLTSCWGTVKALPNDKDFGFITDQNGCDRFFHFSELKDASLSPPVVVNDRIIFMPSVNKKSQQPIAVNIFVLRTNSSTIPVQDETTPNRAAEKKLSDSLTSLVMVVDLANVYRGITRDFEVQYHLRDFFADLKTVGEATTEYMFSKNGLKCLLRIKAIYDPRTFRRLVNDSIGEVSSYLNKMMFSYGIEGIVLTAKDPDDDVVEHVVENIKHGNYVCILSGDQDIFRRMKTSIPHIDGHDQALFIVGNESLFNSSELYNNIKNSIAIDKLCAAVGDEKALNVVKKWGEIKSKSKIPPTKPRNPSTTSTKPQEAKPAAASVPKSSSDANTKQQETRFTTSSPVQPKKPFVTNAVLQGAGVVSRENYTFRSKFSISNLTIKCNANEQHGIFLNNCNDVVIENVQIFKSNLACLRIVNCKRVTIKNCTFEGSLAAQGISIVNSSEIILDNVTCRNNNNAGIDVRDDSHHITIRSSKLLNNDKAGLRVYSSKYFSCENTKFHDVRDGNGIVFQNVQYCDFTKQCSFMNNHYSGMDLRECSNISFTECDFSENRTRNGVALKNVQDITFHGCKFNSNKGSAFDISKGENIQICNSELLYNGSNIGEISEKSTVRLTECKLEETKLIKLRDRTRLITDISQPTMWMRLISKSCFEVDATSEIIPPN